MTNSIDRFTLCVLGVAVLVLALLADQHHQRIQYLDQRLDAAVTICDARHERVAAP